MRDSVTLRGVVLRTQPIGEYDKRLVILTRETGRITAFARGVRRARSPLIAAANPFVFAEFTLYEGRDSYTLADASVRDYFTDLAQMMPEVFYGYYVLELAEYYGREGLPAAETVDLVFVTLRALMKRQISPELIRRICALRAFVQNGDYAIPDQASLPDAGTWYALRYAAAAPLPKLYSFSLDTQTEQNFIREVDRAAERTLDRRFKTLEVIHGLTLQLPD